MTDIDTGLQADELVKLTDPHYTQLSKQGEMRDMETVTDKALSKIQQPVLHDANLVVVLRLRQEQYRRLWAFRDRYRLDKWKHKDKVREMKRNRRKEVREARADRRAVAKADRAIQRQARRDRREQLRSNRKQARAAKKQARQEKRSRKNDSATTAE